MDSNERRVAFVRAIPRGERRAEAPSRREWIFQPLGLAFSPQARSGVESACFSLDLIEVGLQICAGPLNHRERANWCATLFGELDQVVQVVAEFARGFDRTGNTHLALPSAPGLTRSRSLGAASGDRQAIDRL